MNRDAKTISRSCRGRIDTLKNIFKYSENPFDGVGYIFKQAISELRKEGADIVFDSKKCRYYNKKTISENWGYK